MTSTVRIIECTDPTELYRHYDGQTEPQDAYIELDLRQGTLLADYDSEVGNALPDTVRHGLERRYRIPVLTADAANRVMREIAPLADRILADGEEEWNGGNKAAVLGEDALAAEAEIKERLGCNLGYDDIGADTQGFADGDLVAIWDTDGATDGSEADEYGITADTTDARLDEIAAEITQNMADCGTSGVAVVQGLDAYLRDLRDDLADADPLTTAELRAARETLGLTPEHLADLLRVSGRTVRHWEQGKYTIPGGIRREVADLKAATINAVEEMTARAAEAEQPAVLVTYRDDEEYKAANPRGRWSASWHRRVCARVAEQTGARIEYADGE